MSCKRQPLKPLLIIKAFSIYRFYTVRAKVMKSVYTHTFSDERERVDALIDNYFEEAMQHEMQHKEKRPL